MLIADAHLDLAYNALRGRDLLCPAAEQEADEDGVPTVGLPDLRVGGVRLACATIFCEPAAGGKPGYRNADEAHAAGIAQLRWYQRRHNERIIELLTTTNDLSSRDTDFQPVREEVIKDKIIFKPELNQHGLKTHATIKTILLLEGADPIRSPKEVSAWFEAGLRMVGLAWKQTRYAGGTGSPGPLTPRGVELVRELDRFGIIHDTSHLAEESFRQLLDLTGGPIIASHSNCRSIVPTDRQLSDEMIRAIIVRGGVIGINFYDRFLLPPDQYGKRRATLGDVVIHIQHICDLAGSANHAGLGTDMDGGFGKENIPMEITTSADLPRLAEALSSAGFSDGDIHRIMYGNWVDFFQKSLPVSDQS